MRLLVIGGTRFLGRHLVEQALQAGHQMTLLNRGRSNPGLFPRADHRMADRDRDLSVLGDSERWDAAIDTGAYLPRQVRTLAARSPRICRLRLCAPAATTRRFARAPR